MRSLRRAGGLVVFVLFAASLAAAARESSLRRGAQVGSMRPKGAGVHGSADNTVQVASNTFTITGTSASRTHSVPAAVNVAANDFSLTLSPVSSTLSAGGTATIAVATAAIVGSAESVTFGLSGQPTGVTFAFAPPTATAGQGSTLTLTAASTLAAGSGTLTITGTAASANHGATLQLTRLTLPTATLSAPLTGASVTGTVTATASATVSSGTTLAHLALLVDGVEAATSAATPATFTWDSSTVSNGAHTLTARTTDGAGNAASSSAVQVSVSNIAPPTVAITAPTAGSTVSGSVTVTATATAAAGTSISGLSISIDGTQLILGTSSPLSSVWDSSKVTPGQHSITAQATDAAGHTVTSPQVEVTVQAPAGGCATGAAGYELFGLVGLVGYLRRRRA